MNPKQLDWMVKEAAAKSVSSFGKRGGIVLDEMSIQDDIQVTVINGGSKHDSELIKIRKLMKLKIKFDRYYCINSKYNTAKCLHTIFYTITHFHIPYACKLSKHA